MTKTLWAVIVGFVLIPFGIGCVVGVCVLPRAMDRYHQKPALALKTLPPSTIQVGPYQWTVRFVKTGDEFGEIIYRPLELRIGEDLPPDQVKETMLHEIFHATMFVGGGGTSGPVMHGETMTDDQFIEQSAPTMLQVFRDNPDLVKWLAAR